MKELNPEEYFKEVNKIFVSEVKIGTECFGVGG